MTKIKAAAASPSPWDVLHSRTLNGAGTVCRIYGINPLYGRLLATLFLSVEPLSLSELADRTQAAKSTVSVAVRRLAGYRAVKRQDVAGDRRDFYVVNLDGREMLMEFLQSYLRRELEIGQELLTFLQSDLAHADGPRAPSAQERAILLERVQGFAKATDAMAKWVDRLLSAGRVKRGLFEFLGFRPVTT